MSCYKKYHKVSMRDASESLTDNSLIFDTAAIIDPIKERAKNRNQLCEHPCIFISLKAVLPSRIPNSCLH